MLTFSYKNDMSARNVIARDIVGRGKKREKGTETRTRMERRGRRMSGKGGITGGDIIMVGIRTVVQMPMLMRRITMAREMHVGLLKMSRGHASEIIGSTGTVEGMTSTRLALCGEDNFGNLERSLQ
jgi:hypothetical protein